MDCQENFKVLDLLTVKNGNELPDKWCSMKITRKMVKEEQWQIFFSLKERSLYTKHGVVNGAIQTETREVVPKSVRTIQEQALQEARKRYNDKILAGYTTVRYNTVGHNTGRGTFSVMLAKNYEKVKYPFKYPVICEAKLDGIRMYCYLEKGEIVVKSRTNRISFPHITKIRKELTVLLSLFPKGTILDGEIYSPDLTFREITSIVRTEKKVHENIDQLEYHIFDLWVEDNLPLERRRKLLYYSLKKYRLGLTSSKVDIKKLMAYRPSGITSKIFTIETKIAHSEEDLCKIHRYFTERGYEGTMIKRLANKAKEGSKDYKLSLYRQGGRGDNITKMKDLNDEEGLCVGVKDATGREKGAAILNIKDPRGNLFSLRMKGAIEDRKKWLHDPSLVVGKKVTYAFQVLSDYGVPIFPRGIAIRDYE